jgi:Rieske Fe-S protein
MKRRKFIEQSCLWCIAGLTGSVLLQACASAKKSVASPAFTISDGVLTLAKENFTAQQFQVIRSSKLSEQIFVIKNEDGSYSAFEMKCTHAGGGLKIDENSSLKCNLHGSRFSFDGQVMKGPAKKPLKRYAVEVTAAEVKIKLS